MLTALGKWIELGTHVRGAVRNGCSEVEIREALLQARCVLSGCVLTSYLLGDLIMGRDLEDPNKDIMHAT